MRFVLPAVLLLAALALAGCGADPSTATPVVIVVTATPGAPEAPAPTAIPPTVAPTDTTVPASATPDAAATAQVDALATVAAENEARAALAAAAQATQTEEARPTATPLVLPGIGGTLELNDWRISLAKMETRSQLVYSAIGQWYRPSGQFVLLWVDARNLANTSRTLRDTLLWGLEDDHKADYAEQWTDTSEKDQENLTQFIAREGRSPLYANVTPRGITHALLIFDVAADTQPAWFWVASQADNPPIAQFFDLRAPAQ